MIQWLFGFDDPDKPQDWEERHVVPLPDVEAFVVAPNGHGDALYRELGETDVLAALDWALATYPVDPRRVTITGPSMGGIGSAIVPLHHPGRFAAAAPLCGYHDMFVRSDVRGQRLRPWERRLAEERSTVSWAENGLGLPCAWPTARADLLSRTYASTTATAPGESLDPSCSTPATTSGSHPTKGRSCSGGSSREPLALPPRVAQDEPTRRPRGLVEIRELDESGRLLARWTPGLPAGRSSTREHARVTELAFDRGALGERRAPSTSCSTGARSVASPSPSCSPRSTDRSAPAPRAPAAWKRGARTGRSATPRATRCRDVGRRAAEAPRPRPSRAPSLECARASTSTTRSCDVNSRGGPCPPT